MVVYDAFISYSHAKDKPVATALQSVVQTLGKPWYRRRMLRVFRDDTSLSATPHLWPSIAEALDQSRFFILLASCESAASLWVQKEIDHWLHTKPKDQLLIALTDGVLQWDAAANDFLWSADTPLPAALKRQFEAEPKWVDLSAYQQGANRRDHRFIELSADFAAAIQNVPKEDLLSQEVRQQRTALLLAWSAASVMLALGAVSAWQWHAETTQRNNAIAAQAQAERNYSAAKVTVDRLIFNITQQFRDTKGIESGTITRLLDAVQTTVDKLIEQNPNDQDLQLNKSVMLDEFVKSYVSAGDTTRAFTLAKQQVSMDRELAEKQPANTVIRVNLIQSIARLADLESIVGDFPASEKSFREGLALWQEFVKANPSNTDANSAAAMAWVRIGTIALNSGDLDGAQKAFEEGARIVEALGPQANAFAQISNAVSLVGIAQIRLQAGQTEAAWEANRRAIDKARDVARRYPDSLTVANIVAVELGNLALIDAKAGDIQLATETYEEAHKMLQANVERDPGNLQIKGILLTLESQWNFTHQTVADDPTALKQLVDQARATVSHDPDNTAWQMNLANALQRLGDKLYRDGQAAEAKAAFQEEYEISTRFLQRDAKNLDWQRVRAHSLQKRADALLALNDRAASQADLTAIQTFAEQYWRNIRATRTCSGCSPSTMSGSATWADSPEIPNRRWMLSRVRSSSGKNSSPLTQQTTIGTRCWFSLLAEPATSCAT